MTKTKQHYYTHPTTNQQQPNNQNNNVQGKQTGAQNQSNTINKTHNHT